MRGEFDITVGKELILKSTMFPKKDKYVCWLLICELFDLGGQQSTKFLFFGRFSRKDLTSTHKSMFFFINFRKFSDKFLR